MQAPRTSELGVSPHLDSRVKPVRLLKMGIKSSLSDSSHRACLVYVRHRGMRFMERNPTARKQCLFGAFGRMLRQIGGY